MGRSFQNTEQVLKHLLKRHQKKLYTQISTSQNDDQVFCFLATNLVDSSNLKTSTPSSANGKKNTTFQVSKFFLYITLLIYQHLTNVCTRIHILSHLLISPFLRQNSVPKLWSLSNSLLMVSVAKESFQQQVRECKACLAILSCFAHKPVNCRGFLSVSTLQTFNQTVFV